MTTPQTSFPVNMGGPSSLQQTLVYTPTFSALGAHVGDADADGPWSILRVGSVYILQGVVDVDITADLANEGFSFNIPAGLGALFIQGSAVVTNKKTLTIADSGKVTTDDADPTAIKGKVEFAVWDGGGAITDIKVYVCALGLTQAAGGTP